MKERNQYWLVHDHRGGTIACSNSLRAAKKWKALKGNPPLVITHVVTKKRAQETENRLRSLLLLALDYVDPTETCCLSGSFRGELIRKIRLELDQ